MTCSRPSTTTTRKARSGGRPRGRGGPRGEPARRKGLRREPRLYAHDWAKPRELLKRAADLDLLRLEIPPEYGGLGLDKVSAAYVGEPLALNPSFGGSLGTHTSNRT